MSVYLISKDQPTDVQVHLRKMKYVMSNLKKEAVNCKMHMPGTVKCRPAVAY